MKKHGFTVAEVLITLGIIAIGAAVLAPTYIQLKPDRYKLKVLNCYKLANEATKALLSNPTIYFRKPIDGNITSTDFQANGMLSPSSQYGCNGLRCTEQPTQTPYNHNRYSGVCKYPNLMVDFLKLENITYCDNSSTSRAATGTMNNSIAWRFVAIQNGAYGITIDMDSSANSPQCSYKKDNPNKCTNPDLFLLGVNLSGDISGLDPLTKVYLKNMTNTCKTQDYEEAAQE